MNKWWGRYLWPLGGAGGITGGVLWLNGWSALDDPSARLKVLADAFTVSGGLLVLLAALLWVASDGFFDGIGYACRLTARMLFPFWKTDDEKYFDYKQRRAKKRGQGYSCLFVTGAVCLTVSLSLIAAFYRG